MDYIYSRVSTDKQTTENQVLDLLAQYPNATVVEETGSGAKARPILDDLLGKMQRGDRLVIVAIDRLGRSIGDLVHILDRLGDTGVVLISKREGTIDKTTAMGSFIFNIMASVAQMERDILIERTRAGLSRTKASGTKLGRRATISDETRASVAAMRSQGHSLVAVGSALGISKSRVHEIERELKLTNK